MDPLPAVLEVVIYAILIAIGLAGLSLHVHFRRLGEQR